MLFKMCQAKFWSQPPRPVTLWLYDSLKSHILICRICLDNQIFWIFSFSGSKIHVKCQLYMNTLLYMNMTNYLSFKKRLRFTQCSWQSRLKFLNPNYSQPLNWKYDPSSIHWIYLHLPSTPMNQILFISLISNNWKYPSTPSY